MEETEIVGAMLMSPSGFSAGFDSSLRHQIFGGSYGVASARNRRARNRLRAR